MADENLEYTPPELIGLETFRCDENGEKDLAGRYISVRASALFDDMGGENNAFLSVQISVDYGEYGEPYLLTDGVPLIMGDGMIDPEKIYHVCYAVSDSRETSFKVIVLYVNTHRAALGYMGGGFGIYPPLIDDGWYFNGPIKVPVYDDDGNITNWRIL